MAFVGRTERIIHIAPPKPTSDLGPGQYLSFTPLTKNLKHNKAPFLTTGKRSKIEYNVNTPGPGAYVRDKAEKFIITNRADKVSDADFEFLLAEQLASGNSRELKEINGFMSNVKRFKAKKEDIENPGPGSYLHESQFRVSCEKQQIDQLKNKKGPQFKNLTGTQCRVLSIPNKNQGFGYELVNEKEVKINEDPDMSIKCDGLNVVGPGRYETQKPTSWHRKGTSWSKSKVKRMHSDTRADSLATADTSALTNSMNVERELMGRTAPNGFDKRRVGREKIFKYLNQKEIACRTNVQTARNCKLEGIDKIIYEVLIDP